MERLRRLAWRVRHAASKPSVFFLRGHPRSGTNWVGSLLNLHPRIQCTGEYHLDRIALAVRQVQAQAWHLPGREPVRGILDAWMADLVRRCLAAAPAKRGATVLGDRTPYPLPADGRPMVPGAAHILTVRDGRDVLVSWRFHLLRQPPDVIGLTVPSEHHPRFHADAETFRADPGFFATHPGRLLADEGWVRYAADRWAKWVLGDRAVLERTQGAPTSLRVHTVRYEDLHADVEGERRKMYEFLGLDPSGAAPVSHETKTAAGFGREDNRSFYRHGQVGDWQKYAANRWTRAFKEATGPALIELGYEKDGTW